MRVGVRLVQFLGPPAEIVDLAVWAEECGLDEVWIPHDPFMTSAWSVTSAIAARTERIRIGSIGTNPYTTDASEIAAYLGTLDLLSNGRAILGLGLHTSEMVGWVVGGLVRRGRQRSMPRLRYGGDWTWAAFVLLATPALQPKELHFPPVG